MKKKNKEGHWVSLSDIMTGLMIIFLFIAISYISQVKKRQKEKDEIIENFQNTKAELYQELKKEFEQDFKESRWHAVLEEDLSIRFLNERVLFDYDKAGLKNEFKAILDEFFPRYMKILLQDKYRDQILEVRIEGHTDSKGAYMYNVHLSQQRTASVLDYILTTNNAFITTFPEESQRLIHFWLIATGYSSGRTLDDKGQYTLHSRLPENRDRSRRVEFRIVTKTDKVLEDLLKKM